MKKILSNDDDYQTTSNEQHNKFIGDYDPVILEKERIKTNNAEFSMTKLDCPICKNKGFIMITEGNYNGVYPCQCTNQYSIHQNMLKSGISENITMDKFKTDKPFQKKMKDLAKHYIENFEKEKKWFWVGGMSGSGKTTLSQAILNALMQNGAQGHYKRWHEVVAKLKEDINSVEANRYIYELSTVNLLYIDDFLKNHSQSDLSIAFKIIQGRTDRNLPTIISSEMYLEDLDKLDTAIASRIKQMCGSYVLVIERDKHKNYRLEEFE